MHTAPVSWRAEKKRPPAATIAFVTARFPLPIRPNTTSPPRAWTVRPTASETSIGRTLAFGRNADSGVVAGTRRPHGGGRVRARPRRALVRDAVRRAAGRVDRRAVAADRRDRVPALDVRGRAGGARRHARRLPGAGCPGGRRRCLVAGRARERRDTL